MKRKGAWSVASCFRILLLFFLSLLVVPGSAESTAIPYSDDYAYVRSQLSTPQAVADYLTAYFTYDDSHYGFAPYAPAVFNGRRKGDCKDYATFFSDVLAAHGYVVNPYAFRYDVANNYGHVVSVFTDTNGNKYVATNNNNAERIYGPISSLDNAGELCIANGALPQGSIHDDWQKYPPGFTGWLIHTYGFVYSADYQQVKSQLHNFQDPSIYMAAYFDYQKRPGSYAASPSVLNAARKGDAKDFAVFSSDISYATVYSFRYDKATNANHFISVVEYGGQYYFQSYQYFFGPVATFDGIVDLCKANGHIPAASQVDSWQSYPHGYLGPYPTAATPLITTLPLLLQ